MSFDQTIADLTERRVKGKVCSDCGKRAFHKKDCVTLAATRDELDLMRAEGEGMIQQEAQ